MSQNSSNKTTNPIINTILVLSIGLSALELSQLIFDPSHAASLTALDFNAVIQQMFYGMNLNATTLYSFWAVLVAWAISGLIAGIRAKSGFWGGFAGFFGTILGAAFLLIVNVPTIELGAISEFIFGTISCAIVATITAYATGSATKVKKPVPKSVPTRKIWSTDSTKKIWICNKCGEKIPPGAFSCPKCGELVIE